MPTGRNTGKNRVHTYEEMKGDLLDHLLNESMQKMLVPFRAQADIKLCPLLKADIPDGA